MKNGKMIVLCMCALVIGIAITLPLTYFTPRTAATTQIFEPWFTMDIPSAYIYAYLTDDTFQTETEFIFPISINYDVLNRHTGARIEFFEFVFYTDGLQLSKHQYFVAMNTSDIPFDSLDSFVRNFTSVRETIFNLPAFGTGGNGGSFYCNPFNQNEIYAGGLGCLGSQSIVGDDVNEKFGAILNIMENEQVVYLDVISRGYVLFGDNDTAIVSMDDQVIYHIEMSNSGNGFTFGDNTLPTYKSITRGTYSIGW